MKALVLCEESHLLSRELVKRGYDVTCVDLMDRPDEPGIRHLAADVLSIPVKNGRYDVVAAFPPCTEFAGSGSRWWSEKPPHLLREAKAVARHCFAHVNSAKSRGLLENPVGRLYRFIGDWTFTFQPWEYGTPEKKRTCVWGRNISKPPVLLRKEPAGCLSSVHDCPPGPDRAMIRSRLMPGQVRCFIETLCGRGVE